MAEERKTDGLKSDENIKEETATGSTEQALPENAGQTPPEGTAQAKKKFPRPAIYFIVFGIVAVVLLALSISSAVYSVSRTTNAIDSIWESGSISYTTETREKIETAISYYDALDTNLSLEDRITNADLLTEARAEYTRLSIVQLYKAEKSGENEEVVLAYIDEAREVYDSLIGDSGIVVENYSDLTDAEEQYGVASPTGEERTDNSSSSGSEEEEEIEIC